MARLLGGVIPPILSAAIGLWLMAAPAVLGYGDPAATSDRIAGPVAATFGIIAIWDVVRPMLRLNLPFGAWLVLAPWALGFGLAATVNSLACGVLLAALSLVPMETSGRYGGGWSSLWSR